MTEQEEARDVCEKMTTLIVSGSLYQKTRFQLTHHDRVDLPSRFQRRCEQCATETTWSRARSRGSYTSAVHYIGDRLVIDEPAQADSGIIIYYCPLCDDRLNVWLRAEVRKRVSA